MSDTQTTISTIANGDKPIPGKLKKNPSSKLATTVDSVASSRSDSPAVSQVDDPTTTSQVGDAAAIKSAAATDGARCKHCKMPVEKKMLAAHSKTCDKAKEERMKKREAKERLAEKEREKSGISKGKDKDKDKDKDNDGDSKMGDVDVRSSVAPDGKAEKGALTDITSSAKKSSMAAAGSSNSKKRKATDDASSTTTADKPPTKKQRKEAAAAAAAAANNATNAAQNKAKPTAKPKGPVDVEKQCGVPLPNGAMCARSLTCKSHAMGAKRAVPGRSAPYDVLLANYQKKNQAKQQKAALASTAPLPDDLLDAQQGPVDSDEEMTRVMEGLARARPRPLVEVVPVSARSKYNLIRMKEMLAGALGGNRGATLFSSGNVNSAQQQPQSQTQSQSQSSMHPQSQQAGNTNGEASSSSANNNDVTSSNATVDLTNSNNGGIQNMRKASVGPAIQVS